MITNEEHKQLESDFEAVINNKELMSSFFKEHVDESEIDVVVYEQYRNEGFPPSVEDDDNLNYELIVTVDQDASTLTEWFLEEFSESIEELKEQGSQLKQAYNEDILLQFIFAMHGEEVSLQIKIKDDLTEYMETNGSIEELERQIEEKYNEEVIKGIIYELKDEEADVIDKFNEAKNEAGISKDVNTSSLAYEVTDIKLHPVEEVAQTILSINGKYPNDQYFARSFDIDLVSLSLVDYKITILTDPEDLEKEQDSFLNSIDENFVDEFVDVNELIVTVYYDEYNSEIIEERKKILGTLLNDDLVNNSEFINEIANDNFDTYWITEIKKPSNYSELIELFRNEAEYNDLINLNDFEMYFESRVIDRIINNDLVSIGEESDASKYSYVFRPNEDAINDAALEWEQE